MKAGGWAILTKCQRRILLRIASAYRTVSMNALYVITGIPPMKLTTEERKTVFDGKSNNGDTGTALQEATGNKMGTWQEEWEKAENGEWTRKLIKNIGPWVDRRHGQINFRLTQALLGHGCFQSYLHRFKRADSPECRYCNNVLDDADRTIFECDAWETKRRALRMLLDTDFNHR